MALFKVLAGTLDRVDREKGYKQDEVTPKVVVEHHAGDILDLGKEYADDVERWLFHKAIVPHDPNAVDVPEEVPPVTAQEGDESPPTPPGPPGSGPS